jgi:uncharacterized membrane protein YGL010W
VNSRLVALFHEYDDYHRDPMNRLTHKIAIPLIFFNAIAMLDWIGLFVLPGASGVVLSAAHVAIFLSIVWYVRHCPKLSVLLAASFVAMLAIGGYTPWWLVIFLGIAGWVLQLMGHLVWEKNAPNFMRNGIQALVGPAYFLAIAVGDWQAPAARTPHSPWADGGHLT